MKPSVVRKAMNVLRELPEASSAELEAEAQRRYVGDPELGEVIATIALIDAQRDQVRARASTQQKLHDLRPFNDEIIADRYRVVDALGAGGFGKVYKALDLNTGTFVAIKILNEPSSPGAGAVNRFQREIDALRLLPTRHIVSYIDEGSYFGRPYLVMEYVEGATILEHARRNNLTVWKRVELMIQVCDALDIAHSCGLVHRDFKPDHALVDRDTVKILDFGLTKFLSELETENTGVRRADADPHGPSATGDTTESGVFGGTPRYASPEHAAGLRFVTARSDVFALGLTLYELLTGRRPYADTVNSWKDLKKLHGDPTLKAPPLGMLIDGGADPLLAKIVALPLEHNHDHRTITAGQLASELRRWRNANVRKTERRPVAADLLPALELERRKERRRLRLAQGACVALLTLAAGLAVTYRRAASAERGAVDLAQMVTRNIDLSDAYNVPDPETASVAHERLAGIDWPTCRVILGDERWNLGFTLASSWHSRGEYHAAEPLFREVVDGLEGRTGRLEWLRGAAMLGLGQCLAMLGHADEARVHMTAALGYQRAHPENSPSERGACAECLGELLCGLREFDEAALFLDEADAAYRGSTPPDRRGILTATVKRARVAEGLGDTGRARELYDAAVAGLIDLLGPQHSETVKARWARVVFLADAAGVHDELALRFAIAEALACEVRIMEIFGVESENSAIVCQVIGKLLRINGDLAAALERATESVRIAKISCGESSGTYAAALRSRSLISLMLNDPQNARADLAVALPITEALLNSEPQEYADTASSYGVALVRCGRYDDARPHLEKSIAVREAFSTRNTTAERNVKRWLAAALAHQPAEAPGAARILEGIVAESPSEWDAPARQAAQWLPAACDLAGKKDLADEWRQRLSRRGLNEAPLP